VPHLRLWTYGRSARRSAAGEGPCQICPSRRRRGRAGRRSPGRQGHSAEVPPVVTSCGLEHGCGIEFAVRCLDEDRITKVRRREVVSDFAVSPRLILSRCISCTNLFPHQPVSASPACTAGHAPVFGSSRRRPARTAACRFDGQPDLASRSGAAGPDPYPSAAQRGRVPAGCPHDSRSPAAVLAPLVYAGPRA
jgi:hypothetical protein